VIVVIVEISGTAEIYVRSNAGDFEAAVWWRVDKGRTVWHCPCE